MARSASDQFGGKAFVSFITDYPKARQAIAIGGVIYRHSDVNAHSGGWVQIGNASP
jgi:hypothetical protein